MKSLVLFLHISLLVIPSCGKTKTTQGAQKLSLGQLSTLDLESARFDGDILFDIEWPGVEAKDQALKSITESRTAGSVDQSTDGVDDLKVLPESFLEESYSASETITMTTIDQEQYTCVLPDLTGEANSRDMDESLEGTSPRALLKSLRGLCTKLLMGYWTYEICHSRFVRQYHEEQIERGKFKIDEYFLGKVKLSDPDRGAEDKDIDEGDTIENESSEQPPTFYFTGKSYSYYEVEMAGGTVCDISNEPRSVKIKYICDMDAHQSGTFLHIAELSTCKYEAVVSTKQLCNNKYFRLKENPRHTINCYPEGDAPRRPTVLLEHELSLNQFYPKSSKGTKQGLSGVEGNDFDFDPQESFEKQIARGIPPDEQFLVSFLSGESCLRGGSGWWRHEICYGRYVRQVHEDTYGRVEVYLGYWSESDHKTWFGRTGKRRQSKLQVTHLYTNGDVCDVTGAPRSCQVKFKCIKTSKASQVTIFLEEPTTCSYTLTVEAGFLCPLLEKTNEIGMIILPQSDTQTFSTDSEPPASSGNTKSSPKDDKSLSSSADNTNLRHGTDFHSDKSQSSARDSKESVYNIPDSTHKDGGAQSTASPSPSQDQPRKEHELTEMKREHSLKDPQLGITSKQGKAQTPETRQLEDGVPSTEQRYSLNELGDTKSQSQAPPPEVHEPNEELLMDSDQLGDRSSVTRDIAPQSTVPLTQAQPTGVLESPPMTSTRQAHTPEASKPNEFQGHQVRTQTRDESVGSDGGRMSGAGDGRSTGPQSSTDRASSDRKRGTTSQA